ncbi:L,D-transpeptidase [Microbacterium hominis]|uniref:L,D-transpeptidase n=1 Tax=Microbacterium hominis TaxID=162426 RepID=A0A7D4PMR9_9MICO|nr:L,D-transpeptidase [Microbacterium hominis]QKJ19710.1 L,D-transpeptidase [Microbacterium hominis]
MGEPGDAAGERARARRWPLRLGLGALTALVVGVVVAIAVATPRADAPVAASTPSITPTATATPTPTPSPTPTPTPAGFAENTASYQSAMLPQVNVFAVIPALAVDDAPYAAPTGETATAAGEGAPVWADPTGEPVAYLPREYAFDGTTVPIVEKQPYWVKVLLTGRQAVPSQGNPAQVTGWLRVADVTIAPSAVEVRVDISDRTVDIVRDGVAERIATDFGWGTGATPTPLGRTYIMTTRVVEEYWYTRGHPIVYLSVQSPTLDGFGGADVAVTAFHYHDQRSGAISNGCIRVDPAAITALAALPLGTPVVIAE